MKAEFVQEVFNHLMFKKMTEGLMFLNTQKGKLEEEDLQNALESMKKEGIFEALLKTEQDPKEILDMLVLALENATKKISEVMKNHFEQIAEYLEKQKEVEEAE